MIDSDERTILVTGATGNIGSEPARFLDNSLFISANLSSDTSGDLPALGRFFSPSKPGIRKSLQPFVCALFLKLSTY